MKKYLLLLFLFIISVIVLAQNEEPQITKRVAVIYPKEAMANGIEGTVYLDITVAKEGYVSVVAVKQTDNEILNEAAIDAILRYEFKPMKNDVKITIPIKFKLTREEPIKK